MADPHDARLRRAHADRRTGHPARRLREDLRARADRGARPAARAARTRAEPRARSARRRDPRPPRLVGLVAIGAEWAADGFGTLGRAYETALLATALGLGIQVIFGAFFLALLTMPLRRRRADRRATASDLGRHPGQGRRRRSRALPRRPSRSGDRPRLSRSLVDRLGLVRRQRGARAAHGGSGRTRSRRQSSGTGGRAISEPSSLRGDVLVFTSQDAYAADDAWLESLVAPLVSGRELPACTAGSSRTPTQRLPSGTSSTSCTAPSRASSASRGADEPHDGRDALLERELRRFRVRSGRSSRSPTT